MRERAASPVVVRPSWLVARFAGAGLGPAAVVGARHTLGGDGRRGGPPSRSTLAACTVSVVAIGTALTFGASVRSLLDTPPRLRMGCRRRRSSPAVATTASTSTRPNERPPSPGSTVSRSRASARSGRGTSAWNAIGMHAVEGPISVSIVRGELPRHKDEVALGAATARDLHVGVGDSISGDGGDLRVTGIVALPAIGPQASAHPSLGQGALLTLDGLAAQDDDRVPGAGLRAAGPRGGPGARR